MQYSLNRTRNVRSTAGDVFPLFHRVRGHEVEDGANVLGGGGGDVVEVGLIPAGLVDLQVQAEPLAHGVQGDGVHIIGRFKACQASKANLVASACASAPPAGE